jgi:hypothetical protein
MSQPAKRALHQVPNVVRVEDYSCPSHSHCCQPPCSRLQSLKRRRQYEEAIDEGNHGTLPGGSQRVRAGTVASVETL